MSSSRPGPALEGPDHQLAQTDKDIKETERETHRIADSTPEFKGNIDRLCTIYGVGCIVAASARSWPSARHA